MPHAFIIRRLHSAVIWKIPYPYHWSPIKLPRIERGTIDRLYGELWIYLPSGYQCIKLYDVTGIRADERVNNIIRQNDV